MQSSRLPHLIRGLSAASIATLVALLGHIAGGGEIPGLLGIAVPLLLSAPVCVLLSGRRLSLIRLSISVVASQTLFHALFALGSLAPTGGSGHSHAHHHAVLPLPTIAPGTLEMVQGDLAMWCSHLIAAAVTVVVLHRGETAIHRLRTMARRLATWVRRHLEVPRLLPVEQRAVSVRLDTEACESLYARIERSTLGRRGPPGSARNATA